MMNFGNINPRNDGFRWPLGKLAATAAGVVAARTVVRQVRKNATQTDVFCRNASGSSYRGGAKGGVPHGQGVYESGGLRYEGAFEGGKRHGPGVLTGSHGEHCRATYRRNLIHGDVKARVPKGRIEKGTPDAMSREFTLFYHGMADKGRAFGGDHMLTVHEPKEDPKTPGFDGSAVINFPNGIRCEGDFRDGRLHGRGVITWPRKNLRYENNFVFGFNDGPGAVTRLRP